MQLENIPQELKNNALWCCWRKTDKGKVPYNPTIDKMARSNDRSTFNEYKVVLNYLGNYLDNGGLGLGIFNGYSAIDIDDCVNNGELSDMARDIVDYCMSYTEYSPSGTGIRIIFKSKTQFDKQLYYTNNHKLGLEIYVEGATNKFVTITGDALTMGVGVSEVDIQYILDKYMRKPETQVANTNATGINIYDIEQFLDKDTRLYQLWNNTDHSVVSDSENDLALCGKLAFYLQRDPSAIDSAFVKSPYFESKDNAHKSKWLNRQDYRYNTIKMAIQGCNTVYTPMVQQEINTCYGLNDTGNAHRFIDNYGTNYHYNIDNKMWMVWNGAKWQLDVYNSIKTQAEILIEQMQQECYLINNLEEQKEALKNVNRLFNSNGKENMLKEAQHLSGVPVMNDNFDKDDYLLNCDNCVIDLRTGQTINHNKMLLLSKMCSASYTQGDNKPKRFLQFLDEVFEGNKEIIHFLHKWFGYSLTGDCKEQIMVTFVGDGSNGKSVLLQIIDEILGDYAAVSKADLLIDKKFQNANLSEVARLKGVRFCIVNELKMGDRLDESGVKDLTSGNTKVVARFLYGNEFEFYLKSKINLATNYEPKIIGVDNGIWRRMVKIPCNRIFKGAEIDKDLINKLRAERDAILGWLVEGCLLWQHEGLELPEVLIKEKDNYRKENDVIEQWLQECCEIQTNYSDKASTLYDSFKMYCLKYNEYPMSQTLFGRNFGKKFTKFNNGKGTMYKGVRVAGGDNV